LVLVESVIQVATGQVAVVDIRDLVPYTSVVVAVVLDIIILDQFQ
tara:strand:+ start:6 stop:140 length:135 start_codon:yes stop_codon:yes gene_type:complete